ncbi:Zinc finger matrin-type protein 2, partial [Geodia barretti]
PCPLSSLSFPHLLLLPLPSLLPSLLASLYPFSLYPFSLLPSKDQRNLGMSMKVEKSSLEQVRKRFEFNKKKREEVKKSYGKDMESTSRPKQRSMIISVL